MKVLVIGNSFGRDWINILLESQLADSLDISYIYSLKDDFPEHQSRIASADLIFYALSSNSFAELNPLLLDAAAQEKVFIVGNKNFGENNGQIYVRRRSTDYFESSVRLDDAYFQQNDRLKREYGEKYVDLLTPVRLPDGTIRVFSSSHKFISQDCRHLTRGGAQYYASILDLPQYFSRFLSR